MFPFPSMIVNGQFTDYLLITTWRLAIVILISYDDCPSCLYRVIPTRIEFDTTAGTSLLARMLLLTHRNVYFAIVVTFICKQYDLLYNDEHIRLFVVVYYYYSLIMPACVSWRSANLLGACHIFFNRWFLEFGCKWITSMRSSKKSLLGFQIDFDEQIRVFEKFLNLKVGFSFGS